MESRATCWHHARLPMTPKGCFLFFSFILFKMMVAGMFQDKTLFLVRIDNRTIFFCHYRNVWPQDVRIFVTSRKKCVRYTESLLFIVCSWSAAQPRAFFTQEGKIAEYSNRSKSRFFRMGSLLFAKFSIVQILIGITCSTRDCDLKIALVRFLW
jgi:hypothetical protein